VDNRRNLRHDADTYPYSDADTDADADPDPDTDTDANANTNTNRLEETGASRIYACEFCERLGLYPHGRRFK
jgi:hypothetical protein